MTLVKRTDVEKRVFEGNLEGTDLAGIFQYIHKEGNEGILELQFAETRVGLFFRGDGVTVVQPSTLIGASVLARFFHQDRINREQYDHVLNEAKESRTSPVDVLNEMEIVDGNQIRLVVRDCLEETLFELFFLTQAAFKFTELSFDPDTHWDVSCIQPVFCSVDRIVLDAARRADEWGLLQQQLPTLKEIFRVNKQILQNVGAPAQWDLRLTLTLLDSQRSLEEIIALTALTRYEVCRAVDQLLKGGWIERMTVSDLIRDGERCLKRNQAVLAARYLLLAIERGDTTSYVHLLLARAYERSQEFDKSGMYYCEAARRLIAEGNIQEAFATLGKAVEMVPGATKIREQRLKFYLKYRPSHPLPNRGMVQEAAAIAKRWIGEGRLSEATDLLRRLDRLEHGDVTLKSQIIELLLQQGMINEAILEYEKLGSFLVARGLYEDAKRVFKKILSLDHTRIDIGEKLKRIEKLKIHRKSRRRRRALLLFLLFLVASAALAYTQYSDKAAGEFRRIVDDLRVGLSEGAKSIPSLQDVTEKFPLTPTARDAQEAIEEIRIEQYQKARLEGLAEAKLQAEAASSLQDAERLIDEGRLDEALIAMQQAIERAPNRTWIEEHDLEGQKERVLAYLADAESLYSRSRDALNAGSLAEAFRLTRRLRNEYPKSPFGRSALLPVEIETNPEGVRVRFEGADHDLETPCILMVDPSREYRLMLEKPGFEPAEFRLVDPDQEKVSVVLSKLPRWRFATDGPVTGTPIAHAGVLYLGSRDARVYAVDPTGPALLWSRKLSSIGDVESSVCTDDERLFVGTNDRFLYALDRSDGRILWKYATEGFVKSTPLCRGGRVFFGDSRGFLYSVEARTGTEVWMRDLGHSVLPSILDSGDALLAATQDGGVFFVNWENGGIERICSVDGPAKSPITQYGDRVFMGTEDGRLFCLSLQERSAKWFVATGGPMRGGVAIVDGIAYAGSDDGRMRAIRVDDGTVIADFQAAGRIRSTPLVRDGRVYFGATDRMVYCLQAGDLGFVWRSRTDGPVMASPFEAYGSIFVGSDDNGLYSFDP